jgi:molybdate transport system substrate-binding protein
MKRLLPLPFVLVLLLPVLAGALAAAADFTILSGGAVEPGVAAVVDLFRKETGADVKVQFATAPMIRQRVGGGELPDLVIAPSAVIDDLAKAGKLDGAARAPVGRVGVGVVVRAGAPKPDVSSVEALKRTLIDARAVVYNKASTGLYLEKLFERIGVGAAVKAKEIRYDDGAAVFERIIHGADGDIGFGAITEIGLFRDKGAQYAGPLPADVQNYTAYVAAPSAAPAGGEGAAAFLKFLGAPAARAALQAKGVE